MSVALRLISCLRERMGQGQTESRRAVGAYVGAVCVVCLWLQGRDLVNVCITKQT